MPNYAFYLITHTSLNLISVGGNGCINHRLSAVFTSTGRHNAAWRRRRWQNPPLRPI